jgi:hypothetical protein
LDNNLSAEAKTLLIELRNNQYFLEILSSLDDGKFPIFKPVREGTLQVDDQKANWVFMSGKLRERARIFSFLSGDKLK